MNAESPKEVTQLLADSLQGDQQALADLFPLVYDELHRLAQRHLRRERADHTLQPTALVHEAYLRMVDQRRSQWQSRTHFYCVAATAMRRILVNHAVSRRTAKRGGGRGKVALDEALVLFEERATDLVALDEALNRLTEMDEQKSKIVEMRFFGGLTADEIAQVMGISSRTVERGWRLAKAWLRKEIGEVGG